MLVIDSLSNNFFTRLNSCSGPGSPHYRGFMITLGHTTLGRTPLDEWSARRRDLYFTTHNIHNRETSMPPAGFEPKIPAGERPQTHALDSAVTGIGLSNKYNTEIQAKFNMCIEYRSIYKLWTRWQCRALRLCHHTFKKRSSIIGCVLKKETDS